MVDWIKVLIDKIFNPFTRPFRFVGTSLRQFYPFGNSSGNERTNPEPQRNKYKKCKWRKRTKRHERRPQSEESQSNPTSSSPLSLRPVQGAQRVCVQLKGRRKTLSLLNCPKPKVKRISRTKLIHASRVSPQPSSHLTLVICSGSMIFRSGNEKCSGGSESSRKSEKFELVLPVPDSELGLDSGFYPLGIPAVLTAHAVSNLRSVN